MLRHSIYILLATMYSWSLFAQGQANIFMDSTTFLIGDQVKMQVIVNIPLGNTLVYPVIADLLEEEKLELIDLSETEILPGDENNTFKKEVIMTAWEPGKYQIPEMTFSYKGQGTTVQIKSAPVMLTAISPQVTGDSTYVADIKTILAEQPNFLDQLYWFFTHPVTIAIIILLLAFLAFYAFMVYKNRAKQVAAQTPEELALQRLEDLKQDNPLARHDFQAFHTMISFILREYINGRFKTKALERPVSEFMPQLKGHRYMKVSLFEECKTVLEHADLIK